MEPEKRTGGGGRRLTETGVEKVTMFRYGSPAAAQPMLMLDPMKKEDPIYREPCYLFRQYWAVKFSHILVNFQQP